MNRHAATAELSGKRALVLGLARSGLAATRWLLEHGASVVATDRQPAAALSPEVLALAQRGVRLELGGHRAESFGAAQLVVVSPGVPWELPELEIARAAGAEVVGELEFGARFVRGPLAAVTGTKGKSTTTAALGAMLHAEHADVRVGGNIGAPVCGLLDGANEATRFVLEVSSFQLEGVRSFHPDVAVFLNLSPDHLDRHPNLAAYGAAKARVFENQTETDWAVINADDPQVLALAQATRARRWLVSTRDRGAEPAAFLHAGRARLRRDGRVMELFALDELRVPGEHLAFDLLCAASAASLLGASPEAIAATARAFDGVPHALERVAEIDGVRCFNDSKATNVEAARRSLLTFAGPLHVIVGGRYKGGDFADLLPAARDRVRTVLAIGEAAPLVRDALGGELSVVLCGSIEEAVERGLAAAAPGDTLLLAPACSSFDMFRDYVERGECFKAAVAAQAARRVGAAHG